jgi:hypothetical protein
VIGAQLVDVDARPNGLRRWHLVAAIDLQAAGADIEHRGRWPQTDIGSKYLDLVVARRCQIQE